MSPLEITRVPFCLTWSRRRKTFGSCPCRTGTSLPAAPSSEAPSSPPAGLIGSGSLLEQRTPAGRLGRGPAIPRFPTRKSPGSCARSRPERPIRRGHLSLDMPLVAEDGRIVPVIIESDLPMTAERYVKAIHLIVDHNPDAHLAAFHLTPGHRVGVHLDPDQDEAHHLGARASPEPATARSGRPMPACRSRSTGAADETASATRAFGSPTGSPGAS